MGTHGYLGARTGVARATENFDKPLIDFRHFQLEQLDQKFRRGAADKQLRATGFGTHFAQITAQTVAGAHGFARNHVLARDEGFHIVAQVEVNIAALDALDHAHHQLAFAALIGFDHAGALGFAHFLHNYLLGGLRGDAAKGDGFNLLFYIVTGLDVGVVDASGFQGNLRQRVFHFLHTVVNHLPAAEGVVIAGFTIDVHAHVNILAVFLARGRRQRRFNRFEDNLFFHGFFVGYRIHYIENILAHISQPRYGLSYSGTSRALSMDASGRLTVLSSHSSVRLSFSTPARRPLKFL